MCIKRRESASKRIYAPDNPTPFLDLFCPADGHYQFLLGNGLDRKATPLSWPQRLVLLELALFIAQDEGGEHSLDVRKLARRCGFTISKTIDLIDAAPAFFVRRGRTVWLTHPRLRETPRFRRRLVLRHRAHRRARP